jgi:hypothetical protein
MTTDVLTVPIIEDVDPCLALSCSMQGDPVEVCRDHRCPHRWTREARIDRARRDQADAKERAEG